MIKEITFSRILIVVSIILYLIFPDKIWIGLIVNFCAIVFYKSVGRTDTPQKFYDAVKKIQDGFSSEEYKK